LPDSALAWRRFGLINCARARDNLDREFGAVGDRQQSLGSTILGNLVDTHRRDAILVDIEQIGRQAVAARMPLTFVGVDAEP
jgi:hypothetical protein